MKRINIITPITRNINPNNLLNLVFSLTQQKTQNKFEISHTILCCNQNNKVLDNVLNILNVYKFINVLKFKNKNVNQARNFAIQSISSDYIIHLDPTDIIHPYFLFTILNKQLISKKNNIILSNWILFKNNKTFKIQVKNSSERIEYVDNISNSYLCPYDIALEYLFDEKIGNGFEHWDLLLRYFSDENKFSIIQKFGFFKTDYASGFLNCNFNEYKSTIKYFYNKYPNLYSNFLFKGFLMHINYLNNLSIKYNFFGTKYKRRTPKFYMNKDI